MSKFEEAYKTIGEVVRIIGLKSKKGQSTPTAGLFFDFYRDITEADLKIENSNTLKIKSYNSGFSLKWSSPM